MTQNNKVPVVSIVVPVYNAAAYLRDCVASILCQSFSNFELLLINDGSSDESGIICDELSKSDSRIKVFHKENGGATSARKFGVDNAKGKWIMFVDSDDTMPYGALDDLRKHDDGNTDIIAGTILYKSRQKLIWTQTNKKKISREEYIHLLLNRLSYYGPCSKLIRKDLFFEFNWNEDERVFQNEDLLMLIQLVCRTKLPINLSNDFIHYICVDKEGSMSTRTMSYDGWKLLFSDMRDIIIKLSGKHSQLFSDYVNYILLSLYDCLLTQSINVPQDVFLKDFLRDAKGVEIKTNNNKVFRLLKSPCKRKFFCIYRKIRMSLRNLIR